MENGEYWQRSFEIRKTNQTESEREREPDRAREREREIWQVRIEKLKLTKT